MEEEAKTEILVSLARLDTKMEYVKQGIDELKVSDKVQWVKLDNHSKDISKHSESLGFLKKGLWAVATSVISAFVWFVTKGP